jgi:hypothetical protein
MSPWLVVGKRDDAKGDPGGHFLLVHLVDLEVRAALEVLGALLAAEMSRRVWNHLVLRHFQVLLALTGDRSRVPAPV